ncbi:MAG TPA: SUMF1/EgtB/PvdO family nonheme iron enzyme [Candidatus Binatia bacterium]|nr:SUMF1/EgtB/PvdO family nonheme iron enzyme [Candidatus Binatia bacterium]
MALPSRRIEQNNMELLRAKFSAAWARTDEIFDIVPTNEILTTPIVWRHPFIFYVGHLPAFSWNQICEGILNWKSFNPYFDDLFCRGMDPDVDTGECHWHPEAPYEWPGVSEVVEYRNNVRDMIFESLEAVPRCKSNDIMCRGGRVFQMVLEHEYMHQETLLYMIKQLPNDKKIRPWSSSPAVFSATRLSEPVAIAKGKARLGANFTDLPFGWDNEFREMTIDVPPFKIDSLPVTNRDYFEFVASGCYDDDRYWLPEDWRWKCVDKKHHPNCWKKVGDDWFFRAMFDELPLNQVAGWPVYVSLAEARAFARWRGKRLPTEAEFHRAAFYGPSEVETTYPWGDDEPERHHGNFDFAAWSPVPVGCRPGGTSRWGVRELVGNGWEITDSAFLPLPGFEPYITRYPDYSQDFFNGKHFVMKGGSWATALDLLRPSFRNWYQAHYPYVFSKFRCVSN